MDSLKCSTISRYMLIMEFIFFSFYPMSSVLNYIFCVFCQTHKRIQGPWRSFDFRWRPLCFWYVTLDSSHSAPVWLGWGPDAVSRRFLMLLVLLLLPVPVWTMLTRLYLLFLSIIRSSTSCPAPTLILANHTGKWVWSTSGEGCFDKSQIWLISPCHCCIEDG